MVLKAYSIRDEKSEIFHLPFFKHTHGEAEREFKTLTNDNKSTISKFPEDYDLFHIGTYDDNTGKFEPLVTPTHMVKAIQLKEQAQSPVSHLN